MVHIRARLNQGDRDFAMPARDRPVQGCAVLVIHRVNHAAHAKQPIGDLYVPCLGRDTDRAAVVRIQQARIRMTIDQQPDHLAMPGPAGKDQRRRPAVHRRTKAGPRIDRSTRIEQKRDQLNRAVLRRAVQAQPHLFTPVPLDGDRRTSQPRLSLQERSQPRCVTAFNRLVHRICLVFTHRRMIAPLHSRKLRDLPLQSGHGQEKQKEEVHHSYL